MTTQGGFCDKCGKRTAHITLGDGRVVCVECQKALAAEAGGPPEGNKPPLPEPPVIKSVPTVPFAVRMVKGKVVEVELTEVWPTVCKVVGMVRTMLSPDISVANEEFWKRVQHQREGMLIAWLETIEKVHLNENGGQLAVREEPE
jgi:hypothetical protein